MQDKYCQRLMQRNIIIIAIIMIVTIVIMVVIIVIMVVMIVIMQGDEEAHGILEGISSLHSWIKTQTMIR